MNALTIKESILQAAKSTQHWFYARDFEKIAENHPEARKKNCSLIPPVILDTTRSILIYKPDEIGDAICALPAISAIRKAYPNALLTLLCQSKTAPIFDRTGLLDEIVTVNVEMRFLRFPHFSIEKALGNRAFDIAVYLRSYPAGFGHFRKVRSTMKVHPRDPRLKMKDSVQPSIGLWTHPREHQVVQLNQIVSPLTQTEEIPEFPDFTWNAEDKTLPVKLPESYFVVHPYATMETREFPRQRWNWLLEKLFTHFQLPLVVIGALADGAWDPLPGGVDLTGRLNLGQTGYLISNARGFLGALSGPAHWAGALDIPSLIFFGGHSLREEWAPRGTKKELLIHEMSCAPCHRRVCPGYNVACLRSLKDEEIWERTKALFA